MTTFLVSELYPCLQGEGINIGKPSLLVRFQVCNLRCAWCDTAHSQTPIPPKGDILGRFSVEELARKIESFTQRHLILTGGEPTLYPFHRIMDKLGDEFTAEVETNGTQIPHEKFSDFLQKDYTKYQWNISPKGKSAGQKLNHEALEHWARLADQHSRVFFKFVVRQLHSQDDLSEIAELASVHRIAKDHILLMPEGTDQASQVGATWLHDICLQMGYRYTPRLHVLLFGPQRGV